MHNVHHISTMSSLLRHYLVFVYQVVHHVFISTNGNIISQLGLGSVQPVIQGLQGVGEPSREQQSFLQLMLPVRCKKKSTSVR